MSYYITYIKSFLAHSRASSGSLFSFRTPQPPHRDMDDEKDLVDREENDDALDDTNTQVRILLQNFPFLNLVNVSLLLLYWHDVHV